MGAHRPDVRVVLLTMSEELDGVLTALRDGASGYLVKGAGPDRVEQAVRAAAAGEVVLDRELARELAEVTTARRRAPSRPFPDRPSPSCATGRTWMSPGRARATGPTRCRPTAT